MLSSAVSLLLAAWSGSEGAQLTPAEASAWGRIRPSVVTLMRDSRPQGAAALIDNRGLFVAHRASVASDTMTAIQGDGRTITLRTIGQDGPSQLVLLKASPWLDPDTMPVVLPEAEPQPGSILIAVLSTGPIRAEFVSGNRMGVVQPYRRVLPLSEIKFEAPAEAVGGALLFTLKGEFIGALQATLGSNQAQKNSLGGAPATYQALQEALSQQKGRGGAGASPLSIQSQSFGPAKLTIAYSAGPDVLRRVVEGFQSPTHEVVHPTLGVYCTDAVGGGALVQEVMRGHGAEAAGIRAGDILQDINGNTIRSQIDFARVMFKQKPGSRIPIRIKRGNVILVVDALVGQTKLE